MLGRASTRRRAKPTRPIENAIGTRRNESTSIIATADEGFGHCAAVHVDGGHARVVRRCGTKIRPRWISAVTVIMVPIMPGHRRQRQLEHVVVSL